MAYLIDAPEVDAVLDHLDYREKGGYRRLETDLRLADGKEVSGLTYLADAQNPEYLGEGKIGDMAEQIYQAIGPSGRNRDYLFELEQSLKAHDVVDHHVFELAEAVRKLQRIRGT